MDSAKRQKAKRQNAKTLTCQKNAKRQTPNASPKKASQPDGSNWTQGHFVTNFSMVFFVLFMLLLTVIFTHFFCVEFPAFFFKW